MTEEKQIEEMVKAVCHLDRTCDECIAGLDEIVLKFCKKGD
jgi:hypothetical protein